MLTNLRKTVEYLAGQRDEPGSWLVNTPGWITGSIVWLLALVLIYCFCGQTNEFTYINF